MVGSGFGAGGFAGGEQADALIGLPVAMAGHQQLHVLGLLQGMRFHAMGEGFPLHMLATSLSAAAARALCGGIWAAVGSILALLTESASAATIGPLCLFYALLMVGTRFFPEQPAVNPATWQSAYSPWLILGLAVAGGVLAVVLNKKAKDYA